MEPTVETFCKEYGGKVFFASRDEYEKFRIRFGEAIRPGLERNRKARLKSEEAARQHCIA